MPTETCLRGPLYKWWGLLDLFLLDPLVMGQEGLLVYVVFLLLRNLGLKLELTLMLAFHLIEVLTQF